MTFPTRSALFTWLEAAGIAHVARLSVDVLAPYLPRAELPRQAARRRLLDFASADVYPASPAVDAALTAFLAAEKADADAARAEDRLAAPVDPRARDTFATLVALRARIPAAIAPTCVLPPALLVFDPALPAFRREHPRACELRRPAAAGFGHPTSLVHLGEKRVECSCGAPACVHVLATIDTALATLRDPPPGLLDALGKPGWARALTALDRVLDEGAALELTWRVSVAEPDRVDVRAWVGGVPMGRRRLLTQHGAKLDPEAARIAALLPDDDGAAPRALLDALVDQPNVFLEELPTHAVRLERVTLGLTAEARGDAVRVAAGVDGTALPAALLRKVRRAQPGDVLFLWDGRRITLLDVKPELRTVLDVLEREGEIFPPESHAELLTALGRWSALLPVVMPRGIRGETTPAVLRLLLRLEARPKGGVAIEVRVRPLGEGPSFVPGEGPRDVHVRRDGRTLHTVRELRAEVAAAEGLAARLELGERRERRFCFFFPDGRDVLALLGRTGDLEVEWVGRPVRVVSVRGAGSLGVTLHKRREWFGALGGLTVDGERVELARLLDAVRRDERYIEVDAHTYAEVDAALRQHLETLAQHARATPDGIEFSTFALGAINGLQREGMRLEADGDWQELVRREVAPAPPVPEGLAGVLRPYQQEGYAWMARLADWVGGGVLADEMGLGKTVQALALLLARADRGPALIVAPTSVGFNWVEEAARFVPSLRMVVLADLPERSLDGIGPRDVVVVSYGLLLHERALTSRRFTTVILDEAQHLKNAATRRARAARSLHADAIFALTGTPIENNLSELWSLYAAVLPRLLGSWTSFRVRFALPIEKQIDPRPAALLSRILAPFLLRRTKAQVEAQLPPRTDVRVPVVLSSPEWELYEDARLAALSELETRASVLKEQERRVEVLAALTRLRLVASHPRLYDAASPVMSSKLLRFLDLVEELAGQRALVFSQFTSHLALIREALDARGIRYEYLDGQTPRRERAERVRAFQEGTAPLFLLSLKAGGVGLNLTAATNVILLDPWWNPAVEDQASDRAHRIGQARPVTVYRLVCVGTIEEMMLTLHEDKRTLVARVLDGAAGKVSTEELMAFLREGRGVGARTPSRRFAPPSP